MVLTCPRCYQRVRVEDVVVDQELYTPRIETCGRVVIRRRGRVVADTVRAAMGVEVLGKMEARSVAAPNVYIGPGAAWTGDCSAHRIVVETGANIFGGRFRIEPAEQAGGG
ncbi:MAG: hypothetical protein C0475_08795 [Planctomyces sp.]|nr:hypothetical protein [Planctomyces sp.]MBA4038969.1 hypothetical protein [Planctomyces sp.]MBA4120337.1 hypothetical protein [Isosphaera sp.]